MPKFRTVERNEEARSAKRIFAIGAIIAICFGILFSRAVAFRLKNNDQLERVALRQYRTAVRQSTRRGRILDSQGRELAIDVKVDSIYANPKEIDAPVKIADKLSELLGIGRQKLLGRLSSNRKFIWVKRRINDEESKRVKDLDLKGVYSMKENKRFYPGHTLASSILGAVGLDSEPLGGVELACNDKLSFSGGPDTFKRDARGHLYLSPTDEGEFEVADIELTIDRTLQYIVERALTTGAKAAKARAGTVVVADVNTGEIIAMANVPTFDPNEYSKYPLENWRNRAIVDPYEPGSTFKVIVVASALDRGIVTKDDVFDCENGKLKVDDHVVGDTHPHGELSVADIIKVSSNIGAYKVEKGLGRKGVYDAILSFGFGQKSGIDLPGESLGILAPPDRWSLLQYVTIAFGQGIAATPLQMTMAFAAIANGGTLLEPYVVKRIVADDGTVLLDRKREVVGRPISPTTSKIMRDLLKRVVEEGGTGTLAASTEYEVAGKTGTAQKADSRTGGYAKGRYHSSFVGFAPADHPRIAVYVGLDEPRGKFYYGGQVAAPIFREVVEATLRYLKVPGKNVTVAADVMNQLPPREAEGELAVVKPAGEEVKVVAASENNEVERDGEMSWKIPDLKGLTMRGVLEAAGDANIDWRFEGSGIATGQSVEAGTIVPSGTICKVEFKPFM